MKVVHIIFSFNTGGAELMLLDIINEQCKKENIYLIIVNDSYDNEILKNIDKKVEIHKVNRKAGSKSIYSILKLNWLLYKISPDFIHCHHHQFAKIVFKKMLNIKIGLTIHAIDIPAKFEDYHNKYDILFAISNAVEKSVERRSPLKSVVVANGIHFDKIEKKEQYNDKKFKLVQVGRLYIDEKGQDIAIKALDIIVNRKKITDISLDFIGDGKSYDYLNELTIKYGLSPYINFITDKGRIYIYQNMKQYNLLLQPSRLEGFGLTIVEAMAAKIPVLVSDEGGPVEIIENGKYGMMFESGNYIDCAEKILHSIEKCTSSNIEEEMNIIYNIMKNKYDIKKTAEKYLNLYTSLIKRKKEKEV